MPEGNLARSVVRNDTASALIGGPDFSCKLMCRERASVSGGNPGGRSLPKNLGPSGPCWPSYQRTSERRLRLMGRPTLFQRAQAHNPDLYMDDSVNREVELLQILKREHTANAVRSLVKCSRAGRPVPPIRIGPNLNIIFLEGQQTIKATGNSDLIVQKLHELLRTLPVEHPGSPALALTGNRMPLQPQAMPQIHSFRGLLRRNPMGCPIGRGEGGHYLLSPSNKPYGLSSRLQLRCLWPVMNGTPHTRRQICRSAGRLA